MGTKTYFKKLTTCILTLIMLMSVFSMQISIFAEAADVDLSALSELSENKCIQLKCNW